MSNKNKNVGSQVITDTALASTTPEVVAELIPEHALTTRYRTTLPHLETYLAQVVPPAAGEVQNALMNLSEEKKIAFLSAIARMNPVKAGQHTSRQDFRLPEMRMYHGTGSDELRPSECPTGGIYTTDGRVLAAPKAALTNLKHNPKYAKLSTTVNCYLIGIHEAFTFWPPRSGNNPPGVEVRSNMPICRSLDRKRGSYFGSCDACVYRPFKDGKPNSKDGCRNEDHLYVVLADFSGMYRIIVHGKSIKPGSAYMKKKSRPWGAYYEHAFEIETKEQTQNTDRWFELAANVSTDVPDPTLEETVLLNALVRQIDYEVYFPQLYSIYSNEPKANSATNGSAADMDELLKTAHNTPGNGAKDVSANNL